MATPADVLQQAARLQSGTRFERARAAATALSTFLQLPADDKRDLAVLVAQRVAPELVPRIQAEAGVELTTEQSRAVLDMIARLDGDDLQELTASMSSPEARRATLASVTGAAATATGLDDVVAAPDSRGTGTTGPGTTGPSTTGPGTTVTTATAASRTETEATEAAVHTAVADHPDDVVAAQAATLTGRVADLEARLAASEATARTAEQALERVRADAAAATDRADALAAQLRDATTEADILRREHDGEVADLQRGLRRAQRELEDAGGGSMSTRASTAGATPRPSGLAPSSGPVAAVGWHHQDLDEPTEVDGTSTPTDVGIDAGPNRARPTLAPASGGIADLVDHVEQGSSIAALRTVAAAMPRLATATPGDRAHLLEAIPDGWARRRALQRMAEAGVVGASDVRLLRLLARTGDQVFAAGSMLAAGVSPDAVLAQVSDSARARLARRLAA